ncbi:MAG TPA: hypothetical protein VEK38_01580 [Candidatus Bathyarchaeia archaeon]|nr:hypothetical protein [Candidatus Bathyarchaeia archaeon]
MKKVYIACFLLHIGFTVTEIKKFKNLGMNVAKKIALERFEKQKRTVYTQSEAHLLSKNIRKEITKNFKIIPYLNIISAALAKEGEFKDTHYAFYHGLSNEWRVPSDIYKKLYERTYFGQEGKLKNFEFLRWSGNPQASAQTYLEHELQDHGIVNDTHPDSKLILVSTNIALFGNVGHKDECSWNYFLTPQSHKSVNEKIFEDILKIFNIPLTYVQELMKIKDLLDTPQQTIIQILIPKELVDKIAYISDVQGIPEHTATVNKLLEGVQLRQSQGQTEKVFRDTIAEIEKTFLEEKESNPIFKDLLEKAKSGYFSADRFLTLYCKEPWKLPDLNRIQARLVLTRELLSPFSGLKLSGLKFYRLSTIKKQQLKTYQKTLNDIVDRMIEEKKLSKQKNAPAA